jgi:hypothetical protein
MEPPREPWPELAPVLLEEEPPRVTPDEVLCVPLPLAPEGGINRHGTRIPDLQLEPAALAVAGIAATRTATRIAAKTFFMTFLLF